MHNQTIVFDLDGTFVDTAPDLTGATNHALASLDLPPVPGAILRPWVSYGARRMIVEALAHTGERRDEIHVDELLARFLSYYEANIALESRPFEGAVEAAQALKRAGARLAICTNKREGLARSLIKTLDLDGLFDGIAGRDTFPVCKPDPGHIIGAVRIAGGVHPQAVMVGDSDVDIQAARAAGIPVVAVTFGYSETPVRYLNPSAIIDDFDELGTTLQRLTAKGL